MSQHKTTDFKHFTKEQMDAGLVLHRLPVDTPSQLSDGFRSGAEWAVTAYKAIHGASGPTGSNICICSTSCSCIELQYKK